MSDNPMILMDSPEAASIQTVTGWVSRRGMFFGNRPDSELMARYHGCTHRKCEKCGELVDIHSHCHPCHAKAEIEKYGKMERRQWNGTDALYSQAVDHYFFDGDELDQYCEDKETTPKALRLIICVPSILSWSPGKYAAVVEESTETRILRHNINAVRMVEKAMGLNREETK